MSLSHRIALAFAALTLAAAPARAQLLDAKVLGSEAVKRIMDAAEAEAKKNGWKVSISIVDAAGELLAFQRLDDAALSSIAVSQGKARTAARFRRPTKALDSALTSGRTALLAFEGLVPVEGGVPISANGKVIGAVGVSGATSQQDAQVAQAGASVVRP
jgi:glc operon protein GlcG